MIILKEEIEMIKKELLGKWDNVNVPRHFWDRLYWEHGFKKGMAERGETPEKDLEGYFRFGGRCFPKGELWTGVEFWGIWRVHIQGLRTWSAVEEFLKDENYIPVMDIEKWRKEVDDKASFEYFIFTPKPGAEKEQELVTVNLYYKFTLMGFGKNRDYEEQLVADGEAEEIARTINTCRSNRFGYTTRLYVVKGDYKVIGFGTP